jgi:hypothetical protein
MGKHCPHSAAYSPVLRVAVSAVENDVIGHVVRDFEQVGVDGPEHCDVRVRGVLS